jgi:hypothetical protein
LPVSIGPNGGLNPPPHQPDPSKEAPLLIQEGRRGSAGVVTAAPWAVVAATLRATGWLTRSISPARRQPRGPRCHDIDSGLRT